MCKELGKLGAEKIGIFNEDLKNYTISELIKDRFYFVSSKNEKPKEMDEVHLFSVGENELGTLNLSTIARLLKKINIVLSSSSFTSKIVVFWVTGSENKRRNAAVCVGVFTMVYLGKDCIEMGRILNQHSTISVRGRLSAVQRALHRGFINFHDFNEDIYDELANVRLHWIVPGKILGFYGPLQSYDKHYLAPSQYLKYFKQMGVKSIVRISHLKYEANPFVDSGLAHYDLQMVDIEPTERELTCFLDVCEAKPESAVVVHCRDQFGRVGCLAATFLVKHHAMGTDKAIDWIRICTPDSIFESQRAWLKKKEKFLIQAGTVYRAEKNEHKREILSQGLEYGICSYTGLCDAFSSCKGPDLCAHINDDREKETNEQIVDHKAHI